MLLIRGQREGLNNSIGAKLQLVEIDLHALKILDEVRKEGELVEVIVQDMHHMQVFFDDLNPCGIRIYQ